MLASLNLKYPPEQYNTVLSNMMYESKNIGINLQQVSVIQNDQAE